jgi:hypothetical protein
VDCFLFRFDVGGPKVVTHGAAPKEWWHLKYICLDLFQDGDQVRGLSAGVISKSLVEICSGLNEAVSAQLTAAVVYCMLDLSRKPLMDRCGY